MKVTTLKGLEKKMLREVNYRWIDHLAIVEGRLFSFPYQSHKDDLRGLIEYCDKNGINFVICHKSTYGFGTFSIEFSLDPRSSGCSCKSGIRGSECFDYHGGRV